MRSPYQTGTPITLLLFAALGLSLVVGLVEVLHQHRPQGWITVSCALVLLVSVHLLLRRDSHLP